MNMTRTRHILVMNMPRPCMAAAVCVGVVWWAVLDTTRLWLHYIVAHARAAGCAVCVLAVSCALIEVFLLRHSLVVWCTIWWLDVPPFHCK